MQSAVIPAAGLSSRMGSSKPLLAWGDTTLVERAVRAALQVCGHVIVVLGYEADRVDAVLRTAFPDVVDSGPVASGAVSFGTTSAVNSGTTGLVSSGTTSAEGPARVTLVRNREYRAGMLSSLRCGAAEVLTEWFYIAPVDMPLITADVYRSVRPNPDADAVFPVWNGRRGHPVLVRSTVLPTLFQAGPEVLAMRDVLREFCCRETPAPSEAVLIDVDTVAEYERLSRNSS